MNKNLHPGPAAPLQDDLKENADRNAGVQAIVERFS
jgi:hypothetical protein